MRKVDTHMGKKEKKATVDKAPKKAIVTDEAPAAIGPYSQAVSTGKFLFVSGMLGIDPSTGELQPDMESQAKQALDNLAAALKAADMTEANVVKTTIFLTDMAAFGTVNEIYAQRFSAPYPARSCVQVSALPKGGLFEIEAIAKK